ncbi:MAG: coenzyme F420-0:L-glutamate ligase [Desulfurococcaceae archaeon]
MGSSGCRERIIWNKAREDGVGELDSHGKPKFEGVDNIAFMVSSATALLVGQRDAGMPVVIIRGLKYEWSNEGVNKTLAMRMSPEKKNKTLLETVKQYNNCSRSLNNNEHAYAYIKRL